MSRRVLVQIIFILLIMFGVAACGSPNSSSPSSTPTDTSSSDTTPTPSPLQLVSVATSVSPLSFYGINCGNTVNFTFTAVITVAPGSNGGPVQYTWNVGSSHIKGSVTFAPGETSKSVTYVLKNVANPLSAGSVSASLSATLNSKTLSSSPASATGICNFPGQFKVASIGISVSPASVTGIACNSIVTFTYTATISVPPETNGGTAILQWAHSSSPITLTFGPYIPGQTTQTVTFTLTGKVLLNDIFPPSESISSSQPNVVTSAAIKPYGVCYPVR